MFLKHTNLYDNPFNARFDFGARGSDWRNGDYNNQMDEGAWRAYFNWMRNENKTYNSNDVIRMWRNSYSRDAKKAWFTSQPPFDPTDRYAPITTPDGTNYLINKANSRESLKMSDASGKLVKANVPTALARQLLGATPDQATPVAAAAATGRRGRPAGVANTPRVAAPVAAGGGDIGVAEVMDEAGLTNAFWASGLYVFL